MPCLQLASCMESSHHLHTEVASSSWPCSAHGCLWFPQCLSALWDSQAICFAGILGGKLKEPRSFSSPVSTDSVQVLSPAWR